MRSYRQLTRLYSPGNQLSQAVQNLCLKAPPLLAISLVMTGSPEGRNRFSGTKNLSQKSLPLRRGKVKMGVTLGEMSPLGTNATFIVDFEIVSKLSGCRGCRFVGLQEAAGVGYGLVDVGLRVFPGINGHLAFRGEAGNLHRNPVGMRRHIVGRYQ